MSDRRVIPITEKLREQQSERRGILHNRARHDRTLRRLGVVTDDAVAATPACMIGSRAESEAFEDGVRARRSGLSSDVCRFSGRLGEVWMQGYCDEPDGAA